MCLNQTWIFGGHVGDSKFWFLLSVFILLLVDVEDGWHMTRRSWWVRQSPARHSNAVQLRPTGGLGDHRSWRAKWSDRWAAKCAGERIRLARKHSLAYRRPVVAIAAIDKFMVEIKLNFRRLPSEPRAYLQDNLAKFVDYSIDDIDFDNLYKTNYKRLRRFLKLKKRMSFVAIKLAKPGNNKCEYQDHFQTLCITRH